MRLTQREQTSPLFLGKDARRRDRKRFAQM
jgi:hypothetical protein